MTMNNMDEPRCLLVATMDVDLLRLLEGILEHDGYRVVGVSSGKDSVSGALAQVPDALILDYDLSDMNGDEVLKNLQSFSSTRSIPAILLINSSTTVKGLTSFRVGSDQILQKPFTLLALSRALERVVKTAPRAGAT